MAVIILSNYVSDLAMPGEGVIPASLFVLSS